MTGNFWNTSELKPLIIAHRGGATLAAENTIAAFRAAAVAGAHAVETDVRLTKDGALVCMHDADLRRLCSDPRAVADVDMATLRSMLPAVMTLEDALSASEPMGILLDIKLTGLAYLSQIIHEVVRAKAVGRTMLRQSYRRSPRRHGRHRNPGFSRRSGFGSGSAAGGRKLVQAVAGRSECRTRSRRAHCRAAPRRYGRATPRNPVA